MAILEDPTAVIPQLVEEITDQKWARRWSYYHGPQPKA